MFVVQIIWVKSAVVAGGAEASRTGVVSQQTIDGASAGLVAIFALNMVFNVLAIIFSALFVWGRGMRS